MIGEKEDGIIVGSELLSEIEDVGWQIVEQETIIMINNKNFDYSSSEEIRVSGMLGFDYLEYTLNPFAIKIFFTE